ncbi:MAG: Gfo/Idh/MocA family protein [Candidatus Zipacnadales bacterium]
MKKVRVALIGAGAMANSVHYPSLATFDDVELVGLCDLVEEKLTATADKFGIEKRYTNYKRMIEETAPEAVYILMPPHHLFDLAIYALEAKLHLFIEKPPGVTTEQTRQMALTAKRNGVLAMVGFNRRYIPLLVKCRELVRERGEMLHCVATFYKHHFAGPYYKGAVDILTSDCIHAVDALRWMAGSEAIDVVGDVRRLCGETYANAFNALLRFENNCSGVLLGNWCVGKRVHTFEMHAPHISAFVDCNSSATIYADNKEEGIVLSATEVAGSTENRVYYGFEAQSRHFIDCIKSGTEPSSSMADAVKTMELVDQIYQTSL